MLNKNGTRPIAQSFNLNNKATSDKEEIVNKFNEYFVNIGPTLADKIPTFIVGDKSFLEGDYKYCFSLFLTSPEEIKDIVTHITTKRSTGFDNVSIEIFKIVYQIYCGTTLSSSQ